MPAPLSFFLAVLLVAPPQARADDLIVLLQSRSCPDCKLPDVSLVHADLRDADLTGANLQGANLGRTRLDGADLRDADLRFSSLHGASLRGADLRGAAAGWDRSTKSGSERMPDQSRQSRAKPLAWIHWYCQGLLSSSSLHNAGVDEAEAGRWPQAGASLGKRSKRILSNR